MGGTKREDPSNFVTRLAKYGLRTDALTEEVLSVSRRSTVKLDANSGRGIPPSRWLRPAGVSELKEWIGVPQSVVDRNARQFVGRRAQFLPTSAKPPTNSARAAKSPGMAQGPIVTKLETERNTPHLMSTIHDSIRQYLYGNARELGFLEDLLDHHIAEAYPFWLFKSVVVEAGGVLEFGPGLNSLVTDILIIEDGGEIRCEGSLRIDCRRIERSLGVHRLTSG